MPIKTEEESLGAVVINEYLEGLVVSSASHTHTKSSALFCVVLVLVWSGGASAIK